MFGETGIVRIFFARSRKQREVELTVIGAPICTWNFLDCCGR